MTQTFDETNPGERFAFLSYPCIFQYIKGTMCLPEDIVCIVFDLFILLVKHFFKHVLAPFHVTYLFLYPPSPHP